MSLGERDALTGLIVIVLFVWLLTVRQADGTILGPEGLQLRARLVLGFAFGLIGIAILVLIALHLACTRLTGTTPDTRLKETDQDIHRRALTLVWGFRLIGILGVITDLALHRRGTLPTVSASPARPALPSGTVTTPPPLTLPSAMPALLACQ